MHWRIAATAFFVVVGGIAALVMLTLGDLGGASPSISGTSPGQQAAAVPAESAATTPATHPESNPTAGAASSAITEPSSATTTIYTNPIAEPTRVVIPSIEVDATIVKVGVQDDGMMEVPDFGYAAWFSVGPAPGASGPSVIVAHVDSKKGPDVFYRLGELKPGDLVMVSDKNGDTATFAVDSSEMVLKTDLPTERIWNETQEPVIRLITCGGEFDRASGHYKSNTIVYGHLVQ